jgi:hypothetical protein
VFRNWLPRVLPVIVLSLWGWTGAATAAPLSIAQYEQLVRGEVEGADPKLVLLYLQGSYDALLTAVQAEEELLGAPLFCDGDEIWPPEKLKREVDAAIDRLRRETPDFDTVAAETPVAVALLRALGDRFPCE